MTSHDAPHPDLDRYLEGVLDERDRRAFEVLMEDDPELQRAVAQDREIRASLERTFAADDASADRILRRSLGYVGALDQLDTDDRSSGRAWLRFSVARRLALAASLVIGLLGAYLIWDFLANSGWQNPYETEYRSIPEVFAAVESGREEFWLCENDRQFVTTFWQQLGYGARLGTLPDDVEALGIGYTNTISPNTIELMALYQGQPILVLIDRLDESTADAQLPPDSDLHLYRREAPPLVFYEVSRLDRPYVLDSLEPVKMPEDWIPGKGRFGNPPFDYGGQRKEHDQEGGSEDGENDNNGN